MASGPPKIRYGCKGVLQLNRGEGRGRATELPFAQGAPWDAPKIEGPRGALTFEARLLSLAEKVSNGYDRAMMLYLISAREGGGKRGRKRERCAGVETGPLVPRREAASSIGASSSTSIS